MLRVILALAQDASSMRWLCSVSLASTQLAYAVGSPKTLERGPASGPSSALQALGVLGCLYSADVDRLVLLA